MNEYHKPTLATVFADIDYIRESWPLLITLKIPGTARSWVETPRRGVLTESDLERMGKKGVPRQAPADVSVLSLLQSIVTTVDDVARTVVTVAGLRKTEFLPVYSAAKDPIPWLRTCATWLNAANEDDPKTVPWVASMFTPLASQIAHLLGDVRAGQVMNGICPWCNGRSRDATRGDRTLQIRYPESDVDDDPMIVCRGVNCSPPSSACGTRWNGYPAWHSREWEWLASQLRTLEQVEEEYAATHTGGDAA